MNTLCKTVLIIFMLISNILADSAPPYGTQLLSDINNWNIPTNYATMAHGILSRNSQFYYNHPFLVLLKDNAVRIPGWYNLSCELIDIERQNEEYPIAGLVFGYVDEKNYWTVTIGRWVTPLSLMLTQVHNGKTISTSIPLSTEIKEKKLSLRIEVMHPSQVNVSVNGNTLIRQYNPDEIPVGKIGLTLQKGFCKFTNLTLSGAAKK